MEFSRFQVFFTLTVVNFFIQDLHLTIKCLSFFVIFFLFYQKFACTCVWDVHRQFFLSSVWYLRISASSAVHTKYLFLPIFGPFSRLRTKENCQIEKVNSKFDHKLTETIIIRANAVKIHITKVWQKSYYGKWSVGQYI